MMRIKRTKGAVVSTISTFQKLNDIQHCCVTVIPMIIDTTALSRVFAGLKAAC